MKRSLVGSSLCVLLLSGYVAPNAGVAFAEETLFSPGQAKPVFTPVASAPPDSAPPSPQDSTIKPADSFAESIKMDGMAPTEYVATIAERIRAAKTPIELYTFEKYFNNCYRLLLGYVVKSNPTTADEEKSYLVVTQTMAMLKELFSACKFKGKLIASGGPDDDLDRSFQIAQIMANSIEHTNLLSSEERRQRILKEKRYSLERAQLEERAQLNSINPFYMLPLADPEVDNDTYMLNQIKELRKENEELRTSIAQLRNASSRTVYVESQNTTSNADEDYWRRLKAEREAAQQRAEINAKIDEAANQQQKKIENQSRDFEKQLDRQKEAAQQQQRNIEEQRREFEKQLDRQNDEIKNLQRQLEEARRNHMD